MKNIKTIFAVALAAVAVSFASCSKENDANPGNGTDKVNSLVKITVPKNIESRAIGGNSKDTELTLVGGKILWSNTAGQITREVTVVADDTPDPISKDQVKIGVLTGASGAVIENVEEGSKICTFIGSHQGTGQPTGSLVGKALKDVKDAYFTIDAISDKGLAVVSNVPIYGADETLVPEEDGGKKYIVADFQVRAIGSRLQIGEIKGDPATVKSFKVAGIWINNYYPQMPYSQVLDADDIIFHDKTYTGFTGAYETALRDVESVADGGMGETSTNGLTWTPSTDLTKFWAYNVFPNKGQTKVTLPHIIIKLVDLIDINDNEYDEPKYLTVKGYFDVVSNKSLEVLAGGNSYTFGGATGLTFTLTDIKDKPEEGEVLAKVKIEAMKWTDNIVTPEF